MTAPSTPEGRPHTPRKARPLRDALGCIIHFRRPDDPERLERIKSVLTAGAPAFNRMVRILTGGGLAVFLILWGISEKGPWGLLNRWLDRTWQQTDALTVEVKEVTAALKEVAVEQKEANKLLGEIIRNQAADLAQPTPKPFKAKPAPRSP